MANSNSRDSAGDTASLRQQIDTLRLEVARSWELITSIRSHPILGCSLDEVAKTESGPQQSSPPGSRQAALADQLGVLAQVVIEQSQGRAKAAFYVANHEAMTLHHVIVAYRNDDNLQDVDAVPG